MLSSKTAELSKACTQPFFHNFPGLSLPFQGDRDVDVDEFTGGAVSASSLAAPPPPPPPLPPAEEKEEEQQTSHESWPQPRVEQGRIHWVDSGKNNSGVVCSAIFNKALSIQQWAFKSTKHVRGLETFSQYMRPKFNKLDFHKSTVSYLGLLGTSCGHSAIA